MSGVLATVLIDHAFSLLELGFNRAQVQEKVQGWADSGMTLDQISDALLALRKANRDDAVKAVE